MKKILIVYNPYSGRIRVRHAWHHVRQALTAQGNNCTILNLQKSKLAKLTDIASYELIVAVGGDGTIRSVVQTLAELNLDIPIAIIPRGSANLLARSLGIPFSLKQSIRMIARGTSVLIDRARLDSGEYFLGSLAIGYLGNRIAATTYRPKKIMGFGGYLWSMLINRALPVHRFRFSVDGEEMNVDGHSLFIINASNLFGRSSAHTRGLADGVFELAVTTNTSFLSLGRLVYDFYYSKKKSRHFILARGKDFIVHAGGHPLIHLDGETIPPREVFHLKVEHERQRFIVVKN